MKKEILLKMTIDWDDLSSTDDFIFEESDICGSIDGVNLISLSDNVCELSKCTRIEVIDTNGRSYTNWNEKNRVDLSVQDDGRTLKIFISKRD